MADGALVSLSSPSSFSWELQSILFVQLVFLAKLPLSSHFTLRRGLPCCLTHKRSRQVKCLSADLANRGESAQLAVV